MEFLEGNITAPIGFSSAAVNADISGKGKDKEDLMIIFSDIPSISAGVFTKNIVKSGTVEYCMENIKRDKSRAMLGLSGIANTCVLDAYDNAKKICELAADFLNISKEEVLPASTGRIGKRLPMEKIKSGFEKMDRPDKKSFKAAARAIMTSDTFPKAITIKEKIAGKDICISCMGKGSGMIHPNMGTTINYATTDIAITKELLQEVLAEAVDDTINMVSIDGDTSTNDTFLIMASGLAGNDLINERDENYYKFLDLFKIALREIAKMLAKDGEGATKLLICRVNGARSKSDAKALAKSIISSVRYKAAMSVVDTYFSRILSNMGNAGVDFDYRRVKIKYGWDNHEIIMYENGMANDLNDQIIKDMENIKELNIVVDLNYGDFSAESFGCDLTSDYVKSVTNY
ncbi:MAG: bifunctional glutamate N-acetyltransferase/amino-acid acetyltransferase ArgJ [Tissierellia bacterium]|nr:bifunctional glutamate N-acetyltransferase/amino-acid acetyltransferase ArgJ [Tissierellia bacterium]